MITSLALLISSTICICLQMVSRNLLFAIVGIMGLITVMLVAWMELYRVKWPFALTSFLGNGFLLANTIAMHQAAGHIINDYIINAVILLLFIALTALELLSQKKKTSRE